MQSQVVGPEAELGDTMFRAKSGCQSAVENLWLLRTCMDRLRRCGVCGRADLHSLPGGLSRKAAREGGRKIGDDDAREDEGKKCPLHDGHGVVEADLRQGIIYARGAVYDVREMYPRTR